VKIRKKKRIIRWRKKMSNNDGGHVKIKEGSEVKGGINPKPTTPRPSQPPKGQSSQRASESKK
jgi:hypothetical protein